MFVTSLRKISVVIGLTLLLTASLGGVVSAAPPAAATLQTDEDAGSLIVSVRENSPAAKAGLVRGDIILAVDGEDIDGAEALAAAILAHETGDEVVLTVLHGDDTIDLSVILGERNGRTYLGVQPYVEAAMAIEEKPVEESDTSNDAAEALEEEADADDGENADVDEEADDDEDGDAFAGVMKGVSPASMSGAIIMQVIDDGPAAEAGLSQGDQIVAVDGEELSEDADLADLIGVFAPGDEVTLEVFSAGAEEGETVEIVVTLGAHPEDETKAFLGVSYMPMPAMFGGRGRMPMNPRSPRGFIPAPRFHDDDGEDHEDKHDDGCDCDYDHHPHGRFEGHEGMMIPFFGFGMEGHDLEGFHGFDFDQLSEEDREKLQEILPFLFPDFEAEPENEGGL